SDGVAAQVHGARAALAEAAAEFRSAQVEHVAQHPQQRHVARHINRLRFPVDVQRVRHVVPRVKFYGVRSCSALRKNAPSVTTISPGLMAPDTATWSPLA